MFRERAGVTYYNAEGYAEQVEREGTGAVVVDGQMVDEATYRNFANTVEKVRTTDEPHPTQTADCYDEEVLERALTAELIFN